LISEIAPVTRLSISDVRTGWDFENGHRLWIAGTAELENEKVPFVYEKGYAGKPEVALELRRMFTSCRK